MRRLHLLLLLALFLCFTQNSKAQMSYYYGSDKLSSSLITNIIQDNTGYIWIATGYGLNKFDGYRFTNYLHNRNDSLSLTDNVVTWLYLDRQGRLWVGTNKGLAIYNYRNDNFEHIHFPKGMSAPRISDIIQLYDGQILAGTAGYGVFKIDVEGKKAISLNYSSNKQTSIIFYSRMYEDRFHELWKSDNDGWVTHFKLGKKYVHNIRSFKSNCGSIMNFIEYDKENLLLICQRGLLLYNYKSDNIMQTDIDTKALPSENVVLLVGIKDKNGNIYIGSSGNGLFYIPSGSKKLFKADFIRCNAFDINSSGIVTMMEDRMRNLWIGCSKKGLVCFHKKKAQFDSWSFSSQKINIGSSIMSMCSGDNGSVWCTVMNNGLFKFDNTGKMTAHPRVPASTETIYRDTHGNYWLGTYKQLYSFNPDNGQCKLAATIKGDFVNYIIDDARGNIYISAYAKGFYSYNISTGKIRNFNMYQRNKSKGWLSNDWIMTMLCDSHGLIWLGNMTGVACYSPKDDSFKPFGWHNLLGDLTCYSLCEDKNGNMLIGTNQGLYIFNRAKNKTTLFPGSEILEDKVICSIAQDSQGDIWCSTSMGIWQYKQRDKRFISYVNGNGLISKEYLTSLGMHMPNDRIFFSTSDGITSFDPSYIKRSNNTVNEVKLTNFYIGGKSVNCSTLSNGDVVTSEPVDESDHFNTSYLDNTFTIEFSLLNYSNAENIIYEYRLNGAKEWTATNEGVNAITFNHLQSGKYILEVRACYNGSYSPIKTFYINVTPPWYSSTYAYLVYLLIFVIFVGLGIDIYNNKKQEELDEEKMKFLINATHDIRSPLTLIMSPIQKLLKKNLDEETMTALNTMDRNAQRILRLVNQLLDIRKLDKKQMQMHCQETDLVDFIKGIYKVFEYHASENNINFVFEHNEDKVMAWIDRINFDKVISNLLSNAFKYTFNDGEIKIILSTGSDNKAEGPLKNYAEIKVIDNGIGIKETKINKVFERFYQGHEDGVMHFQGTGIGLNLCKMIVDLHHGEIKAENRTDSSGTCLTVRIPLGNDHLEQEEIKKSEEESKKSDAATKKKVRFNYKILVVDDDEEIGGYINSELGEFYKFTVCKNGKEGLAELLKNKYDLVISDVMMPEMDGFTLVKMIKSNTTISHIPVILLTSKTDISNRMEGFEKGADSYLSKPFNMEELHVIISNLINNIQRLKGKFSGAQEQEQRFEHKEVTANNDILMDRIMKSINQNMSNSDYNVEMLTQDVGISRAQLHRKMKEMTGIAVSEFIRNLRLEYAAKLLKSHKVNVTQVAYEVGFCNPAHFSTVFHKHFGFSPSEYVEECDRKKKEEEDSDV